MTKFLTPPDLGDDQYGGRNIEVLRTHVDGNTYPSFLLLADGTIKRGPGSAPPGRQSFTPHIYSDTSGTEINYGTTNYRAGWYVDDGIEVRGVIQVRIGTDGDMGPDGSSIIFGLPVAADTDFGNGLAVFVGELLVGWKSLLHTPLFSLHTANSAGDLAYAVAEDGAFGVLFNTWEPAVGVGSTPATTSDGNATTGWHDFHIRFGYFKKASLVT